MQTNSTVHVPIMPEEICSALLPAFQAVLQEKTQAQNLANSGKKMAYLDCTFGGGGHAHALLKQLRDKFPGHTTNFPYIVIGLDRDPDAIERGKSRFAAEIESGELVLFQAAFSDVGKILDPLKDVILVSALADLGISSDQIDSETRGFSFRYPAPLDMRMNPNSGESLAEFLSRVDEKELANLIFEFGEERMSRQIARRLVQLRATGKLPTTTSALADEISVVFPPKMRHGRLHPATRTFQALRIYLNQELDEVQSVLPQLVDRLVAGGRIAVLTFHSLEDRIVKNFFRSREDLKAIFKKPLQASEDEIQKNSRSRSAKLRVAEKGVRLLLDGTASTS